jgi:glycosyltransferase involved in cell wall biosynthesis
MGCIDADGVGEGREVHLFEPTGYAGIFQHACQLASALHAELGVRVVLHTARQHEGVADDGVEICRCCWWPRRDAATGWVNTAMKRIGIVVSLVVRTLPHLLRLATRGSVLHFQGPGAGTALTVLVMGAVRMRGCRVVYSPHDTFSRRGPVDGKLLGVAYRMAHGIVVYSTADSDVLHAFTSRVHVSPLVQQVPVPSEAVVANWRKEWRADRDGVDVVLCAGFIRRDKRLDLLIESARRWPPERRLAVVGEDRESWEECAQLAARYQVHLAARIDFVALDEFTAAIAAADLVVVPAEQASQSGVLVLARQLRTPSVAADIGGMAELASRTFASGDVDALTAAIDAELANPSLVNPADDDGRAVASHARAYGWRA